MAESSKKEDGFPERLRKARAAKDLSQQELANLIDIHPNHVSRYERGEITPNATSIKALADALAVTTDYLLNGNQEDAAIAKFKDRELLEMFTMVEDFPTKEKDEIKSMIDAYIVRSQVHKMKPRAS
mgnify:FL=1